jgi:hypothetical protein
MCRRCQKSETDAADTFPSTYPRCLHGSAALGPRQFAKGLQARDQRRAWRTDDRGKVVLEFGVVPYMIGLPEPRS